MVVALDDLAPAIPWAHEANATTTIPTSTITMGRPSGSHDRALPARAESPAAPGAPSPARLTFAQRKARRSAFTNLKGAQSMSSNRKGAALREALGKAERSGTGRTYAEALAERRWSMAVSVSAKARASLRPGQWSGRLRGSRPSPTVVHWARPVVLP